MFIFSQRLRELLEENIDHLGVKLRTQESFRLARFGAYCSNHPQVVVLRLAHGSWTGSPGSPHPRQRSLLSESRFILKENSQAFARLPLGNFRQLSRKLFLKAACAS